MKHARTITFHLDSEGHLVFFDESRAEYACATPQELWDDLQALAKAPRRNRAQPQTVREEPVPEDGDGATPDDGDITTPEGLYEVACQQAEEIAESEYGPIGKVVVGKAARAGSRSILGMLRNISNRKRNIG